MRRLKLFLVAGLVGSFIAHADEPSTVAAPAASEAASPAAVPAAAAPAQTAGPATPAAAAAQGNATTTPTLTEKAAPAEFHPPSGFKATKQGLTTVYCTSVKTTGSNLPTKRCLTREQIEQMQEQEAATARSVAQKSRACTGQCGAD